MFVIVVVSYYYVDYWYCYCCYCYVVIVSVIVVIVSVILGVQQYAAGFIGVATVMAIVVRVMCCSGYFYQDQHESQTTTTY